MMDRQSTEEVQENDEMIHCVKLSRGLGMPETEITQKQ
jgi:hypothetical protein